MIRRFATLGGFVRRLWAYACGDCSCSPVQCSSGDCKCACCCLYLGPAPVTGR